MATFLSPHFTLEELCFSSTAQRLGLDNSPNERQRQNLQALAQNQLEQARALWGCSIHIDSALRQPLVNKAVGGAKTSQHMDGNAADTIPEKVKSGEMTMKQAYEMVMNSSIQYDQLIAEMWDQTGNGGWIHISRAPTGKVPRRQCLMIGSVTDHRYMAYDGSYFR